MLLSSHLTAPCAHIDGELSIGTNLVRGSGPNWRHISIGIRDSLGATDKSMINDAKNPCFFEHTALDGDRRVHDARAGLWLSN